MPGPPLSRRARACLIAIPLGLMTAAFGVGCDASEDADTERGRQLFITNCGTCHALAEAGSATNIGPDLDAAFARARADGMDSDTIEGVVQQQIDNPRLVEGGTLNYEQVYMPPDIVTGQDAEDVSTYVASVAGIPGIEPPQLDPDELFTERCGQCHAFEVAGTTSTVGPDLDDALAGKDAKYVEQQIVDPNSEITSGYQPNVMPQNFEQTLTPKDIQGLVDYLLGGSGK